MEPIAMILILFFAPQLVFLSVLYLVRHHFAQA